MAPEPMAFHCMHHHSSWVHIRICLRETGVGSSWRSLGLHLLRLAEGSECTQTAPERMWHDLWSESLGSQPSTTCVTAGPEHTQHGPGLQTVVPAKAATRKWAPWANIAHGFSGMVVQRQARASGDHWDGG